MLGAMTQGPVLFAYDGSTHAQAAIERAGAELEHGPAGVATVWTGRETAEGVAAEGAELARAAGFDAEPRAVRSSGPFFAALIEAADELDARAIVAGSRGRSSLRAAVMGSVSTGLLHHTTRPVLIVRAQNDDD